MKRFHVHVAVDDLQSNVRFYSSVFGASPAVLKDDYAKWMLEDPRINFAISTHGPQPGLNHLGIQVDSGAELKDLRTNLIAAQAPVLEQSEKTCCYAKSDKYWITDPQGIAWEAYHTLESAEIFGGEEAAAQAAAASADAPKKAAACCGPAGCA